MRSIAMVDSDGTLTADQPPPAYAVLPPHGAELAAGAAACTPAVTPAALVMRTSAAATEVRSDRTRTDGLSKAIWELGGGGPSAGRRRRTPRPARPVDALCLHSRLSDRAHHCAQVVQVLLQRDTLERLGLGERCGERVEHLAVVLEQHGRCGLSLCDQPPDRAVHRRLRLRRDVGKRRLVTEERARVRPEQPGHAD